ncbi:MAG: cysteine--tRNA ligase [Clostridiales bacterium]|nr:cysteine--tRNA ligase [Clostridiales bacterium]
MKIYNTMSRKKEDFVPLIDNSASMYVCGPTVYDFLHVGNARPLVIFDSVRRYLLHKGFKVNYVQNFTDIDDKIINRAKSSGATALEVADLYTMEAKKDIEGLNCLEPTSSPRVTEEMDEIVKMIQLLIDKGYAYESEGSVFYNTSRFDRYGRLSGKNLDELVAGARVEKNEDKKNDMDFVLWKPAKPGEPRWSSPWGEGRPGWHIECSVMAKKYLGETFDIHAGGEDLIFPHHENEIAQSEAANGKTFARYWMHVSFVNLNGMKMSKSLNNFLTLRDASEEYSYPVIRFFILSAHYRSPIDFSPSQLRSAQSGLERIKNCAGVLRYESENALSENLLEGESAIVYDASQFVKRFEMSMDDDFNTANAVAAIFDLVKYANANVSSNSSRKLAKSLLDTLSELCTVLGISLDEAAADDTSEIDELVRKRQEARKNKDYKTADAIRDELSKRGIALEDRADGVRWTYK